MKYTIIEITGWTEDNALIAGDASHEGDRAVQMLLEGERASKLDFGEAKGLPFTCEAESEEDAIDKYNERFCDGDYLKAETAEFGEAGDCECNSNPPKEEGYGVLVDGGIAVDLPNMLFKVYEKDKGKDPVLEEGGHTEEYSVWYVDLCRNAWNIGINNLDRFADYLRGYASAYGIKVDIPL